MDLKINPVKVLFETVEKDDTRIVTLENKASKRMRYKLRIPPSQVLGVTKAKGVIPAKGQVNIEVMYYMARNETKNAIYSLQVKFVLLDEGESEDIENIENHKNKVDHSYITVSFQDGEDAMFRSPKTSDNTLLVDDTRINWWKNPFT